MVVNCFENGGKMPFGSLSMGHHWSDFLAYMVAVPMTFNLTCLYRFYIDSPYFKNIQSRSFHLLFSILVFQIGQKHTGFVGFIERLMSRSGSDHIWFDRSEMRDRQKVTNRSVFKLKFLRFCWKTGQLRCQFRSVVVKEPFKSIRNLHCDSR